MADQLQKGDEVSLVLLLCFLTLRRKPCIANQCPYIYIYIYGRMCVVLVGVVGNGVLQPSRVPLPRL